MKIVFLGDRTTLLDEGAKNVASNFSAELGRKHDLLLVHQRQAFSFGFLHDLREFGPDLIVSIHGPSPKTAVLLYSLKKCCGDTKTVMIATQPNKNGLLLQTLSFFPPDLILAQSTHWREAFANQNIPVNILPNGVDTKKFVPATDGDGNLSALRAKLEIPASKKIALHIGPINNNRNYELLIRLQKETNWQVLVIGSVTAPFIKELSDEMEKAGVIVRAEYFSDINLIYCMADVYVFPVFDASGSIEMPLTVLEALSCDRPVATSRFRGLGNLLPAHAPALRYFRTFNQLVEALSDIIGIKGNRDAVINCTWENMAQQFDEIVSEKFGFITG